ncbi:MAG: PIG-L deacetylase family protein [Nanobdellota archaeon]
MAENILMFCAHNDDLVIGAGGTAAKYSAEGKDIYSVIFSHGEKSHPWMKPEHTIKTRIKEAKESDSFLGVKDQYFLALNEGKLQQECSHDKIIDIMNKVKPDKIFFHNMDDPHPDHRAVYNIMTKVMDEAGYKGEAYMFDVWTLMNFRKRNSPKMVVDITETFSKKIKAFRMHKSQKAALFSLLWTVYAKAFLNGLNNGYKYAEVFFKLR